MSIKNAFSGLVDRMFRHADLDDALGMDDLTRLERGLPLTSTETGSMPAPDFGEDGPTMQIEPEPRPAPPRAAPAPPSPHALRVSDPGEERFDAPAATLEEEEEPWHGASVTPDEGWMSKGWTLPEEREAPASIYSAEGPVADSETDLPTPDIATPRRLSGPVLNHEPPARDLFTDIEDHPGVSGSFEALEAEYASGVHETRPPVRGTEEITEARLETLRDPAA